jgi:hypothetical protein
MAMPAGLGPDRLCLPILLRRDATISGFVDWWNSGGTAQSAVVFGAVRCNARAALLPCGAAGDMGFAICGGMTMDTGLYRIELTGLAGLARVAGISGSFSDRPERTAANYFNSRFIWLPAVLIACLGAWMLLSGSASNTAENQPVRLATAAATGPVQSPATDAAQDPSAAQDGFSVNPAMPGEAITPAETAPVDGLTIASQSWRRGGLGSKALVTFTLRNSNDYAVKDIEIFCSFARSDGSHLTDRKRVIRDTVNMKSRRTFARMHVGFVNINADQAKCSLVAASHI